MSLSTNFRGLAIIFQMPRRERRGIERFFPFLPLRPRGFKKKKMPGARAGARKGCKFLPARALAAAFNPPSTAPPRPFRVFFELGRGRGRRGRVEMERVERGRAWRENRKRKERGLRFFCLFVCSFAKHSCEKNWNNNKATSSTWSRARHSRQRSSPGAPRSTPDRRPLLLLLLRAPPSLAPAPSSGAAAGAPAAAAAAPPLAVPVPPAAVVVEAVPPVKVVAPVAVFAPVPPPSLSSPVVVAVAVAVAAPRRRGPPVPVPVPVPVCPPPEQLAAQGARDRPQVHKVAVAVVVFWGEGGGGTVDDEEKEGREEEKVWD